MVWTVLAEAAPALDSHATVVGVLSAGLVFLAVLLGLAARLLFAGKLVPRSTLEDARADAAAWREAYLASEQARGEERRQTEELLTLARTTAQMITAIAVRSGQAAS